MSQITDNKYQELFSNSFWEANNINLHLLHSEDSLVLIGNDTIQLQIKFINFDDTFLPIILDNEDSNEYIQKINIVRVVLKLFYYKNKKKLKYIL